MLREGLLLSPPSPSEHAAVEAINAEGRVNFGHLVAIASVAFRRRLRGVRRGRLANPGTSPFRVTRSVVLVA
jgi:hypothetical protein